ncbi:MAG: hypothetical protein Q4C50_05075 [Eubacteriales bacterium]|nr:hypothetical protein [Eubacteriales bacterium]
MMGETGGDYDDGIGIGAEDGEVSETAASSEADNIEAPAPETLTAGTSAEGVSSGVSAEGMAPGGPTEGIALGTAAVSGRAGGFETAGRSDMEFSSSRGSEISVNSYETNHGMNQILETPDTLEQAQRSVESYHQQSIAQILAMNGQYMSEADRERVARGADRVRAIEHNPCSRKGGSYSFWEGKSSIEVSAIDQQQMERSTKHETNHFASKNREIIVPQPEKGGYTVHHTVGTRQSSWFHSTRTGENFDYSEKGRGLNEGITTMYTNQQLAEIDPEKGETARQQGIYPHATEICAQLESIVGQDTVKEAYYGGNIQELEAKVNSLAGEKGYESLRECLDRTLSKDQNERVEAMKEAQTILAKMYEEGGRA